MPVVTNPNGEERVVAVPDLFFSTTDRRGVITGANTVFCNYAKYTMTQVLGSPHNLIRHPHMPAGAFQIMWDLLLAGRPMAAYVKNLAQDGVAYWVFATITPLGDGFLSVRSSPCRTDLLDTADALYQRVLPHERQARAAGASRIDAARRGMTGLKDGIGALGLVTYQDFVRLAVPAEVAARRDLTRWTEPEPNDPTSGPLHDMLRAAIRIEEILDNQMAGLDELDTLSGRLADQSTQNQDTVNRLLDAVTAALTTSGEVRAPNPTVGRIIATLTQTSQQLATRLKAQRHLLEEVRARIGDLRLRVALARLHDEQLAAFVREIASGHAPEHAHQYIQDLALALEDTAGTLTREATATNDGLSHLAHGLLEVQSEMLSFQHHLATWRLLIPRDQGSHRLDPAPIDTHLSTGLLQLLGVRHLAEQCQAGARPLGADAMTAAIQAVRSARESLQNLARQPQPIGGWRDRDWWSH